MEIGLGKPVIAGGGKQVGDVSDIVVNGEKMRFDLMIVHQGLIQTTDRMIERAFVERVEPDGTVHLSIGDDQVDQLPRFFHEKRAAAPPSDDIHVARHAAHSNEVTELLEHADWSRGFSSQALQQEYGSLGGTGIGVESNMPPNAVALDKDSTVFDCGGEEIGGLEAVSFNAIGDLISIVIRSGIVQHHHFEIPASAVASVSRKRVVLSSSRDQVGMMERHG